LLLDFRYGSNPHEGATAEALPEIKLFGRAVLSLNAYLDMQVGSAVASSKEGRLVYVKHALPAFYVDTCNRSDWRERFEFCKRINKGRDFGCFVLNGLLSIEAAQILATFRHHTILCKDITADALAYLQNADVQASNRGLLIASGEIRSFDHMQVTTQTSYHKISLDVSLPTGHDFASDIERVVRLSRTLAVGIFIDEELVYNCCGFLDPIEALEFSLQPFVSGDNKSLTVATDACFGVKDPEALLANSRASTLYLFGAKAEYPALIDALQKAGVTVHLGARRAFSYPA
jgi:hypothetical protein